MFIVSVNARRKMGTALQRLEEVDEVADLPRIETEFRHVLWPVTIPSASDSARFSTG